MRFFGVSPLISVGMAVVSCAAAAAGAHAPGTEGFLASGDKEATVYMAKLAEQAGRYDEMAEFMKQAVHLSDQLTVEERDLLAVAFKNATDSRRASLRILTPVEQKEIRKGNTENAEDARKYRESVLDELGGLIHTILYLLEHKLIPNASEAESKVFYYKMVGDYHRYYIAEHDLSGSRLSVESDVAREAYENGMAVAANGLLGTDGLHVTHPLRLSLALNFSKFCHDVLNRPDMACLMARDAFVAARAELENGSEDSYQDSTTIMQILRDNLKVWTSEDNAENVPVVRRSSLFDVVRRRIGV